MSLARILLPALVATAPLQTHAWRAPRDVTLSRTYECLRFVYRDQTSFSIEHIVNVMSDGSVISRCALNGALQGASSSVFPRDHAQAATGQCTVNAFDQGTPTGESWTLELIPTKTYSRGTFHAQNSAQDGLVYSLACTAR
jgi:hypothetical protein